MIITINVCFPQMLFSTMFQNPVEKPTCVELFELVGRLLPASLQKYVITSPLY